MGCIDDWDHYAEQFCPVQDVLGQVYHWSLRQVKYSTDLMFRSEQILVPIYDAISRQAVLAANAERVSGFLGKKITPQLAQEIGSRGLLKFACFSLVLPDFLRYRILVLLFFF